MELCLRIPGTGLRLRFSFWFFAVATLFLLMDQMLLRYVAIPVLIHELGHVAAMLLCGARVDEIRFTPVSIQMMTAGRGSLSYGRELFVAAGGILANGLAALWLYKMEFSSMRNMMMTASHLAVGCFHLLPVSNLDGGQLLRLLLQRRLGPQRAARISRIVSGFVLVPLTLTAVGLALCGILNFTAPALCLSLVAGFLLEPARMG